MIGGRRRGGLCWVREANANPRIACEYRSRPGGGAFVRLRAIRPAPPSAGIGGSWIADRLPFGWPLYDWPHLIGVYPSYEAACEAVSPDAEHYFVGAGR